MVLLFNYIENCGPAMLFFVPYRKSNVFLVVLTGLCLLEVSKLLLLLLVALLSE